MLFTWDTTDLCIVFPSWRVTGTFSLIWSLIAVVALTAGYEAIREVSRRYEERLAENVKNATSKSAPSWSLGGTGVRACNALLTIVSSRCRT
jgi:copper transporter 1